MPRGVPIKHAIFHDKIAELIRERPNVKSPTIIKELYRWAVSQGNSTVEAFPKERTVIDYMRKIRDEQLIDSLVDTDTFDIFTSVGNASNQIRLEHAHLAREVVHYYRTQHSTDIIVGLVKWYIHISVLDLDRKCDDHEGCLKVWSEGKNIGCAIQQKALTAELMWCHSALENTGSATASPEYEKTAILYQSYKGGEYQSEFQKEVAARELEPYQNSLWRKSELLQRNYMPQFQKTTEEFNARNIDIGDYK